jgi:hypothetical protein
MLERGKSQPSPRNFHIPTLLPCHPYPFSPVSQRGFCVLFPKDHHDYPLPSSRRNGRTQEKSHDPEALPPKASRPRPSKQPVADQRLLPFSPRRTRGAAGETEQGTGFAPRRGDAEVGRTDDRRPQAGDARPQAGARTAWSRKKCKKTKKGWPADGRRGTHGSHSGGPTTDYWLLTTASRPKEKSRGGSGCGNVGTFPTPVGAGPCACPPRATTGSGSQTHHFAFGVPVAPTETRRPIW